VTYDALLVVSFGGPEAPDQVMPFLERVTRGRGVPRERLEEVATHYHHVGGVSPIMGQSRALVAALERALDLPVVWGNRNAAPFVADAVRTLRDRGVRRALAITASAFGSYSGCRQYREDVERARAEVEGAPPIDVVGPYGDHPGFLAAQVDRVRDALVGLERPRLLFTAHSIPIAMAQTSPYERQLRAACAHVAGAVGVGDWELAWQSRSGAPHVPWLEPDVLVALERLAAEDRARPVVLAPIGFTSDHMEVVWDLDHDARLAAAVLGLPLVRAGTVGTHPLFVGAIVDVVAAWRAGPVALTTCGPSCCPAPRPR
jgi:ferrochelatase